MENFPSRMLDFTFSLSCSRSAASIDINPKVGAGYQISKLRTLNFRRENFRLAVNWIWKIWKLLAARARQATLRGLNEKCMRRMKADEADEQWQDCICGSFVLFSTLALDNSDNSPGSLYQLAQQFLNSIVNYELYLNFYEYKSVLNIISRGRMGCAMINGNGSLGRNNFRRRRRWRFFSIQIIKFSDNRTVGERQSWEEASQKFPTLTLDAISAERPANENIS